MTKERRMAIKMWEDLLKLMKQQYLTFYEISEFKQSTCRAYHVDWQHNCWLCQYVRKDHRYNLTSRKCLHETANNCTECPLYKWYAAHNHLLEFDMCGCDIGYRTLYGILHSGTHDEQIKAAELILRALKGEAIWTSE